MTVAEALQLTDEELDAMLRHHDAAEQYYHAMLTERDRRQEGDRRALVRWNSYERRIA
jgi:hypothetical protein